MSLNNNKITCGWKGCENVYQNVESMNVHVQADHMFYRVLLQTEYQGRSFLNYDNPQSGGLSAPPPKQATYPPVPVEIQSSGPLTLASMSAPVTPTVTSAPVTPLVSPMIPNEISSSGPILPATPVSPIPASPIPELVQQAMIIDEEMEDVEDEDTEEADELDPPPAKKPFVPAVVNAELSPLRRKGRKFHSKYWTYTDHLTYRCNVIGCTAEFNNPDSARHHYRTIHSLEDGSASPDGQSSSNRRSSGGGAYRQGSKKVNCTHSDCTRYFYSQEALERHLHDFHVEDTSDINDANQYKAEEDPEDTDYDERDDEMKEGRVRFKEQCTEHYYWSIPGKDKDHFYY